MAVSREGMLGAWMGRGVHLRRKEVAVFGGSFGVDAIGLGGDWLVREVTRVALAVWFPNRVDGGGFYFLGMLEPSWSLVTPEVIRKGPSVCVSG